MEGLFLELLLCWTGSHRLTRANWYGLGHCKNGIYRCFTLLHSSSWCKRRWRLIIINTMRTQQWKWEKKCAHMHFTHLTHMYTWAPVLICSCMLTCDGRASPPFTCSWRQHGNKPTGTTVMKRSPTLAYLMIRFPLENNLRGCCAASDAIWLQRRFSFCLCLFI